MLAFGGARHRGTDGGVEHGQQSGNRFCAARHVFQPVCAPVGL